MDGVGVIDIRRGAVQCCDFGVNASLYGWVHGQHQHGHCHCHGGCFDALQRRRSNGIDRNLLPLTELLGYSRQLWTCPARGPLGRLWFRQHHDVAAICESPMPPIRLTGTDCVADRPSHVPESVAWSHHVLRLNAGTEWVILTFAMCFRSVFEHRSAMR